MSAADLDIVGGEPDTTGGRIRRALARGPLHIFLILMGLFWMTPTFGLLVSSFRSAADNSESGWWTALATPSQLTLTPYRNLLDDSLHDALETRQGLRWSGRRRP